MPASTARRGSLKLNKPVVGIAATRPARATGWSPPTVGSSTTATPSFSGSTGSIVVERADRGHRRVGPRPSDIQPDQSRSSGRCRIGCLDPDGSGWSEPASASADSGRASLSASDESRHATKSRRGGRQSRLRRQTPGRSREMITELVTDAARLRTRACIGPDRGRDPAVPCSAAPARSVDQQLRARSAPCGSPATGLPGPEPRLQLETHVPHNWDQRPAESADVSRDTVSLRRLDVPTLCGPSAPTRRRSWARPLDLIGGTTDPDRSLMTRIIRSVGFVLALASVGLGGGASGVDGQQSGGRASDADTPLPPGWELCVLEGLAAPATPANIADLDEWQAAEGGSTNNTAAFNPFNSLRTTDVTGAPIPGVDTSNNFPAFSTWAAGCSATVATLYQPNMWVITAALRAGNVTPASAFLAVVDQSAWCAVSPAGVPCYVNEVLSGADSLPASLPVSSALNVYGSVKSDLLPTSSRSQTVSADQNEVGIRDLALAAADSNVATAREPARRRFPIPAEICRQRVRQQRAVLGRSAREQWRDATSFAEYAAGLGWRRGAAVPRRGGQQFGLAGRSSGRSLQGRRATPQTPPPRPWRKPPSH